MAMHGGNRWAIAGILFGLCSVAAAQAAQQPTYDQARWDPIHFKPAIESATDEQCLACHKEVLAPSVLAASPAGVTAAGALAWYQTLETYEGPQETFHRRHLVTPLAQRVMALKCNTCHQGNDPREEAPGSSVSSTDPTLTLRKMVDPNVCLMCHAPYNYEVMNMPGPWAEHRETFQTCMACHAAFRTNRHKVNFLKAEAIETAGNENADSCYGCHGGRAWYRIHYPYPRHDWDGMPPEVPDWAKARPKQSDPRFLKGVTTK
jgi:hypothetical protein